MLNKELKGKILDIGGGGEGRAGAENQHQNGVFLQDTVQEDGKTTVLFHYLLPSSKIFTAVKARRIAFL